MLTRILPFLLAAAAIAADAETRPEVLANSTYFKNVGTLWPEVTHGQIVVHVNWVNENVRLRDIERVADNFKRMYERYALNNSKIPDLKMKRLELEYARPLEAARHALKSAGDVFGLKAPGLERPKRDLTSIVGMLSFGAMGLWENHKINTVQTEVGENSKMIKFLAEEIDHQGEVVNQLAENQKQLLEATKGFMANTREYLNSVHWEVVKLEIYNYLIVNANLIQTWANALEGLKSGRLPLLFLPPEQAGNAVSKIAEKAAGFGLTPVFDEGSEAVQMPYTTQLTDTGLMILLEVPLTHGGEYKLLQRVKTPVVLRGLMFSIETEDHLAVNSDLSAARQMSWPELNRCRKSYAANKLACELGVTEMDPKNTCLGALYIGETEHLNALCLLTAAPAQGHKLVELSPTTVLFFTTTATQVNVACGTETTARSYAAGTHLIELDDGCKIITSEEFYGPVMSEKNMKDVVCYEERPISLTASDFLREAEEGESLDEVYEKTASSLNEMKAPGPVPIHAVQRFEESREKLKTGDIRSWVIAILVIVLLLVLAAAALYLWWRCRGLPARRAKKALRETQTRGLVRKVTRSVWNENEGTLPRSSSGSSGIGSSDAIDFGAESVRMSKIRMYECGGEGRGISPECMASLEEARAKAEAKRREASA